MDSPEAPRWDVFEGEDTDSVSSSQVLRTSNQSALQHTQAHSTYNNRDEGASKPLSGIRCDGLPEPKDHCDPQQRVGTRHAQPSSKRKADDNIEQRRPKRPRSAMEHEPRDNMANEVASMSTEIMKYTESLMVSQLESIDAKYTDMAGAILATPVDFSSVITRGRKIAKEYAVARHDTVEPYRKVVAAFEGQEAAQEKAREFYEIHPTQLVELLELMCVHRYRPKH